MEDYPQDRLELEARFSTEAACQEYLFRLRWPDGFCCPRCGSGKAWPLSGTLMQCSGSITAGTIFQESPAPDDVVPGLQRVLGLKSYKTAPGGQ